MKNKVFKNIKKFLEDIWEIPVHELSPGNSFIIRQLRIIFISVKGFITPEIQLRATALTLYSLLSIVPVLAVAFGIAKGFGFDQKLTEMLKESMAADNQKQVIDWAIHFATNMLKRASGGIIAGIGVVFLFWSVMKVMGNIESALNHIWQVKKARTFFRKVSDYLTIMLFAPVLLFIASGVTVFMENTTGKVPLFFYISPFVINLFPYILMWLVFTLVYVILPNTRVPFKSAFWGGVIAGTIFQLVQWGYITFQHLLTSYGAIYGSFAALPLFIMWLQISWQIVLFGAEVAFVNQNLENFDYGFNADKINKKYAKILAFLIIRLVVKNFENGKKPLTAVDISHELDLPPRTVLDILFWLTECGIFVEVFTDNYNERAYQPALDINKISVAFVLARLDEDVKQESFPGKKSEVDKMAKILNEIADTIQNSAANKLIKDI